MEQKKEKKETKELKRALAEIDPSDSPRRFINLVDLQPRNAACRAGLRPHRGIGICCVLRDEQREEIAKRRSVSVVAAILLECGRSVEVSRGRGGLTRAQQLEEGPVADG